MTVTMLTIHRDDWNSLAQTLLCNSSDPLDKVHYYQLDELSDVTLDPEYLTVYITAPGMRILRGLPDHEDWHADDDGHLYAGGERYETETRDL